MTRATDPLCSEIEARTAEIKTERIRQEIETKAGRIKDAQVLARAWQEGRSMSGGKFFALLDDERASDERLDAMAEDLMQQRALLEGRAKRALETKHDRIKASIEYIDRLEGKVKAVEDSNAKGAPSNGGPTVQGSADSPKPSPATDGSTASSS